MSSFNVQRLREIKTFPSLVKYLRDELDWPIESDDFEELTYEYEPEELGIDAKTAVKIKEIKQLRPLSSKQPWGIFFINFEPKQLPIVVLRRILRSLVIKKRASANRAQQAAWQLHDLLFISSYGESEHREITFAHFNEPSNRLFGDLPTLRVLGWDDDDTKLKIDHIVHTLSNKMRWPADENNIEAWRTKWSDAFELRPREVITTSKDLAVRLADLAKSIRQRANLILRIESERGPLRMLHKAFQTALIHDLSEDDFADMYAQTIAYGLLTEKLVPETKAFFTERKGSKLVINPFLSELLEQCRTIGRRSFIDFDELGIQEVVDLLNSPDTHMEDVLRDFGKKKMQEDPIIHFYELFLKEYDKKKKVERGVFYTPQPVVSYIVRSVHELLQKEFGLEYGLASIITWGEMAKRNPHIKIPERVSPDEPFVQILDPATGTATFLVEVIEVIYQTMISKWRKDRYTEFELGDLWNDYVSKHLLPRVYGFELMMSPYAIAHMRIGLKLFETGYKFGSNERVHIYLTNSLEPSSEIAKEAAANLFEVLAHEANAVNAVKRDKRFTVVIGNPPYSVSSANMTVPFILSLIKDYKKGCGVENERRIAPIQDDYIKFIRLAHFAAQITGCAIIGYISNNSYLDGLIHRAMRNCLLNDFDEIIVLDLRGSTRRGDTTQTHVVDENVFDIQQGVCITFLVRKLTGPHHAFVDYAVLFGNRESKYSNLLGNSTKTTTFRRLAPASPYFFLAPKDFSIEEEWNRYLKWDELFFEFKLGFMSGNDQLLIDHEAESLERRIRKVLNPSISESDVAVEYGIRQNYPVARMRRAKFSRHKIIKCAYRLFDDRYTYYDDDVMERSLYSINQHLMRENLGLCVSRQLSSLPYRHAFVTNKVTEMSLISNKTKEANRVVPLYLYKSDDASLLKHGEVDARHPNLKPEAFCRIGQCLGLSLIQEGKGDLIATLGPELVFSYTYAILNSPTFRERYAAYLEIDFPRLSLTSSLKLFGSLAKLGGELVALHLMESPKLNKHITCFIGKGTPEVEKVSYSDETVWIDKNKSQGFQGIPENVWNFHIGGYQVCEKWLKDRKGRTLSADDINHYHRIIVALNESIRIMAEIDKVIEAHGGWPGAFQDKKAAKAEYTFQPEPLLKAAEETAPYSPQGKVEVYSKSTPSLKGDWQTWLALSEWVKESRQINTYWIDFAQEISHILKAGKQPSDKQKENMKKCWDMAVKKGFIRQ